MITKETLVEDIVEQYPYLVPELAYHRIQCVACGEPVWGTIGEQAQRKHIQNINTILGEMNRIIAENGDIERKAA